MVGRSIVYASLLLVLCGDGIGAQYDDCINGTIDWIQNGYCNNENNDESCGYDGGGCCECTCINGTVFDCGSYSDFFCRDPNSDCVDPRIEMYPNCTDGDIPAIGNGHCDLENNNEMCLYDGGNCCECTCIKGLVNDCGEYGFVCRDPNSDCVAPEFKMYPNCTNGFIPHIEDGYCDVDNNNEECGYDGGIVVSAPASRGCNMTAE